MGYVMSAQNPSYSKTDEKIEGTLFGQDITFRYSHTAIAYAIVFLRVALGWVFFQAGVQKILNPEWTAAGYLTNVPEGNPLLSMWASFAGNPVIDFLNAWGAALLGICLILGLLVRWSAFWGAVMMLFYWASGLEGGLTQGLPVANGWIVDEHIIYALLLFGLGAIGAGRVLGLDRLVEQWPIVKNNSWLRVLLG